MQITQSKTKHYRTTQHVQYSRLQCPQLQKNIIKNRKQSILNAVRAVYVKQSTAKQVIRQQNNTNNKNYNRQLFLPTHQQILERQNSIIGTVRQPVSQLVSQLLNYNNDL